MVSKNLHESILTNIVEEEYAFYVQPEIYINISDYGTKEKQILVTLKENIDQQTKGKFNAWTLQQRAKWISKNYVTYDGQKYIINSRELQGDCLNIRKKLLESKRKIISKMRKGVKNGKVS